jgi:hypothetical protein
MDGGEGEVVVVEVGRLRIVGAGGGRVERKLGEEAAETRCVGGGACEQVEVAQARKPVRVVGLDQRLDSLSDPFYERAYPLLAAALGELHDQR